MIETILHFHKARVLVDDMALRNILIADDLSIRMIDFGQCALSPLDADINVVSDHGLTALADIFHLGCIIYSIFTWRKFGRGLFRHDWTRPSLSDLPDVDKLFCCDIIRKCWSAEYISMEHLHRETRDSLERACRTAPNGDLDSPQLKKWIIDCELLPKSCVAKRSR